MITRAEVLMGRDREYPLSPQLEQNLEDLLRRLNNVRALYGKPMLVTSGYRPGGYNRAAGGAAKSCHLICKAADFSDPDGELAKWLLNNLDVLVEEGLWLENPKYTKGWVHLQTRPVAARVFKP